MPLLGPYVLSLVMCDWEMVARVYGIQCFVGAPVHADVGERYPVCGHVWQCMPRMW